eukprot:379870-Rhodomonas_salina.2
MATYVAQIRRVGTGHGVWDINQVSVDVCEDSWVRAVSWERRQERERERERERRQEEQTRPVGGSPKRVAVYAKAVLDMAYARRVVLYSLDLESRPREGLCHPASVATTISAREHPRQTRSAVS